MNKCLAFQFWEIAFKGDKAVLDNVLLTVKDSGKHLGMDYGHTMAKFFSAQIQIPIPNKYLGFSYWDMEYPRMTQS